MKYRLLSVFLFAFLFTIIPHLIFFSYLSFGTSATDYIEFDNLIIQDYTDGYFVLEFDREIKQNIDSVLVIRRTYLVTNETHREIIDFFHIESSLTPNKDLFIYQYEIDVPDGEYYVEVTYNIRLKYGIEKLYTVDSNHFVVSS